MYGKTSGKQVLENVICRGKVLEKKALGLYKPCVSYLPISRIASRQFVLQSVAK